jgi:hypothetical protein
MKEDVLEQIVDDYLKFSGYFTTHNVRFRPRKNHLNYVSKEDSVHSDVDVVGLHPRKAGVEHVVVVSCKAWQIGFDASAKLAELRGDKKNPKRETWKLRDRVSAAGNDVEDDARGAHNDAGRQRHRAASPASESSRSDGAKAGDAAERAEERISRVRSGRRGSRRFRTTALRHDESAGAQVLGDWTDRHSLGT